MLFTGFLQLPLTNYLSLNNVSVQVQQLVLQCFYAYAPEESYEYDIDQNHQEPQA
jgi:hypothetical protein